MWPFFALNRQFSIECADKPQERLKNIALNSIWGSRILYKERLGGGDGVLYEALGSVSEPSGASTQRADDTYLHVNIA